MRVLLTAMLLLSGMALAGEAPPLKTGDWLEWRLTVPGDPLEARLASEAETKEKDAAVPASTSSAAPAAELPGRWKTIPFRWKVTETGLSLQRRMGDAEQRSMGDFSFSISRNGISVAPPVGEKTDVAIGSAVLTVNGAPLEVRTERWSTAPGVEWERWTSETVPGGLVRMAGPNADLVLVGWGNGEEPAFPLDAPTPPTLDVVGK